MRVGTTAVDAQIAIGGGMSGGTESQRGRGPLALIRPPPSSARGGQRQRAARARHHAAGRGAVVRPGAPGLRRGGVAALAELAAAHAAQTARGDGSPEDAAAAVRA